MNAPPSILGSTLVGKYKVKRLIGAGGMGAVYEGEFIEIGKRVAIKVLSKAAAQSEEVEARFRLEARAASAVESSHIVQVFDVGHDPVAGFYMVMEYLDGEDLATLLAREGRLDLPTVFAIASQCARGLVKAHAANVIHRDLKPANIFLVKREDGSLFVKILDFGVSKLLRNATSPSAPEGNLTRIGSVIGTPQYMSPEQAQGLDTVDHRTDIWSLGVVLYETIAGRPAYEELRSYEQMIVNIVINPPPSLLEIAPGTPPELVAFLAKAMDRDPNRRFPDFNTFLQELSEVATKIGLSSPPPSIPPKLSMASLGDAADIPGLRRTTSVRIVIPLALGALAAGLSIGGFIAWRNRSSPPVIAERSPTPITTGDASLALPLVPPPIVSTPPVETVAIDASVLSVVPPSINAAAPKGRTVRSVPPRPAEHEAPAKFGGVDLSDEY